MRSIRRTLRWRIRSGVHDTTFYNADKLSQICSQVSKLLPPSVIVVFLKSVFNGWPTHRRMNAKISIGDLWPCRLGCCGLGSRDMIEHYLICPVLMTFANRYLQLDDDSEFLSDHYFVRVLGFRIKNTVSLVALFLHNFA